MAITRRQFLRRSGLVAGGLASYGVMGNPLVRRALAGGGGRFFVVIFLDGGNDGLNTVTPIDDGVGNLRTNYQLFRGNLRLSTSELLPIGLDPNPMSAAALGLHPGLQGLKNLYDQGVVAVLQGCGYPDYSLSHEESRGVWETGAPFGGYGTGWVGRHLIESGFGALDIPGVTISDGVANEFRQYTTSILAINELEYFGFPYDYEYPGEQAAKRAAFLALYAEAAASGQAQMQYLGNSGNSTLVASEDYPVAHGLYLADRSSWNDQYEVLDTGMADRLREVAKIMYAVDQGASGVSARYFQVSNGGYDTHGAQGAGEADGRHTELHREVAEALEVFYSDVADMGLANDLVVLVWSEFSRRIQQNSNGTDHGSQGPMFVIGGTVNGGVYGNHPNIDGGALNGDGNTRYSQDLSDPWRSLDFRDIYGTVLKQWLGMTEAEILPAVLVPEPLGYDPNIYWVDGNHDFDLPFLDPGGL